MPNRTALCLILLAVAVATAPAMARDVRQLSPNGDGGCPEEATDAALQSPARGSAARDAANRGDTRPAATRGGEQGVRPPRWHSFLPGMFR